MLLPLPGPWVGPAPASPTPPTPSPVPGSRCETQGCLPENPQVSKWVRGDSWAGFGPEPTGTSCGFDQFPPVPDLRARFLV